MAEDKISVVARIRPEWGSGQAEWTKNGERNIMRRDGSEIYTFDDVFDQLCNNMQIYDRIMAGIVESALAGFNTAVCAYGQSGAGKTHTLTGSGTEDGLVQCIFQALFDTIAKSKDRNYMLRISYVEIYNERVRDLLSDQVADLPMYENKDGVAQIEGLKEVVVTEISEVEDLLEQAQEHRQLGETLLNERSSRSHTIIRLTIESHDGMYGCTPLTKTHHNSFAVKLGGSATRCSVMNLVDLAGSENAAAAGTQGLRQKEGANINRSLLALSKVVSSLADKQKFIPYRDSKLTRILKPSLGGNSKTIIICCIAPYSVSETSSTLKVESALALTSLCFQFAKQAKKIITRPVVNEANDDGLLSKYLREIERLKQELEKTKKENDEEERSREQKLKLAELMKGILNGQGGAEVATAMEEKLPSVRFVLDEKSPEAGDAFVIPRFVPSVSRAVEKANVDVQTCEAYPVDRSDEVLTLKRGNSTLVEQLTAKTRKCLELEAQREEIANAFEAVKGAVQRIQEVEKGAIVLQERLDKVEEENRVLKEENARLSISESETSPSDRLRLLARIDEYYAEQCKLKKEVVHATDNLNTIAEERSQQEVLIQNLREKLSEGDVSVKAIRDDFADTTKQWAEERQQLLKTIEELKEYNERDSASLIAEKEQEIAVLKTSLSSAIQSQHEAQRLLVSTRSELEKELQQQYSSATEKVEEELQQLRKDNADMAARIELLMNERNSPCSSGEMHSLREEVAELKDVIERQSKALKVAETHKEELAVSCQTIDRLSREKKDLSKRLRHKEEQQEMLSSRINALRDEINENQNQIAKLEKAKATTEAEQKRLKEDNQRLQDDFCRLREEYGAYRVDAETQLKEKGKAISALKQQAKLDQNKILHLDTDLAIAVKDVERYKNTISSMAIEAQSRSSVDEHLKKELDVALQELSVVKAGKQKADDVSEDLSEGAYVVGWNTDVKRVIRKLPASSQWLKEKTRLLSRIQDLERQIRDMNEIHGQQQRSSKSDDRSHLEEERNRMFGEIARLREQLMKAQSAKETASTSSKAMEKMKQDFDATQKELNAAKDKIDLYRRMKLNGIQYVDELKAKIKMLEKNLAETKEELSDREAELERVMKAKSELELLVKENSGAKAKGKG
ncbi:unnamed protein product [Heligmosomoides polygyrus]|uniref:Kinesin motor domain-containing protein n=1 Tax=Heligmosomoides polygyrus TaxID=6339 RepID=A0A3P8B0L3_HELPZ|nr:unnamed protein product [Heligmosomoides polygyrus]